MELGSFFQINTKGLCLFCLKDCAYCPWSFFPNNDSDSAKKSAVSFKMLLRYLKVNVYQLCNFSTTFLESMDALEDAQVMVAMCPECADATNEFAKLYQDMELIRIQLDNCVRTLHTAMRNGEIDNNRVQEYRRRMRSRNVMEMFNADVADRLRHETMEKCSLKVEGHSPRTMLYKPGANTFSIPVIQSVSSAPAYTNPELRRHPTLMKHLISNNNGPPRLFPQTTIKRERNLNDSDNPPDLSMDADADCSEEFVVKVEPILDLLSTNIDENEEPLVHDGNYNVGQYTTYNGVAKKEAISKNLSHKRHINEATASTTGILHQTLNERPPTNSGCGSFQCNYCGKRFGNARSLLGHKGKVHRKNKAAGPGKVGGEAQGSPNKKSRKLKKKYKKRPVFKSSVKNAHRFGLGGKASSQTLTCVYCDKVFTSFNIYRTHLVSLHTLQEYSSRLPRGTTQDELSEVIKAAIADHKPIPPTPQSKKYNYGCPFCINEYPHPSHLRLHVIRCHFDKLADRVSNQFYRQLPPAALTNGDNITSDNADDVDDGDDEGDVGGKEGEEHMMTDQNREVFHFLYDGDGKVSAETEAADEGNEEEEEEEVDPNSLFPATGEENQAIISEADPLLT